MKGGGQLKPSNVRLLFARLRRQVEERVGAAEGEVPAFVLFASLTDGAARARTVTVSGAEFGACWRDLVQAAERVMGDARIKPAWLRVDWVERVEKMTWSALETRLRKVKRNYYRFGISLDSAFHHAFLETELNANAMLYGGPGARTAVVNDKNFRRYARIRHGLANLDRRPEGEVWQFSTRGVFLALNSPAVHELHGAGRDAGRRVIARLEASDVRALVAAGSGYLASQVGETGRFTYGWHPCFDREIPAYNGLRHASSLYAMIEAWGVTRDATLGAAIERALAYLMAELIRADGEGEGARAFLVEENGEIKLGGNAVAILALCKYCQVTGRQDHLELARRLAEGVLFMQDAATGRFRHVFAWPDMQLKDAFRIIYYDGEAAFALMRIYELTRDERLLDAVESAFRYFIEAGYWNTHDHWLAYAADALALHRPRPEYYAFGVRNVAGYLDFVIDRITTYPTLLELMMAAERMVSRMQADPALRGGLAGLDLDKFYHALEVRAHYLLNGHFWPELAMFFANPRRICGSFFIRHHAFRVRIDDVEHYLSGLVAYLAWRERQADGERRDASVALAM
ncbi:hypothetical protein GCM10019059_03620 [Camelimonas fluminis]|nr:hypothetical protein GCM10019059_03620 [Camelimonas fluminis]